MNTLSSRAESVLHMALSLNPEEQVELAHRLCASLAPAEDGGSVPAWHKAILADRLAEPDDEQHTFSAEEVRERLESTISRLHRSK